MGKIATGIKRGAAIAAFTAVAGAGAIASPAATLSEASPRLANTDDPSIYNPSNNDLPNLRACIANVESSATGCLVIWAGTSTASGFYSGGTGAGNGYSNTNSLEPLFAQELTQQYGVTADANAIFGYPVKQENGLGHSGDTRIAAGNGWGQDTVTSIGGPMFANASTTETLSFILPTTTDTTTIYYPTDDFAHLGTFTYQINNGPVTTVDEGTAAPGMASATITGITPGANTLTLKRVSGTVKFIGEVSSLSTSPAIHIINSGVGGWKAANWDDASGKPYATNAAWSALSPAAVFIEMSNNDATANTPDSIYKTEMGKIITGAGAHADAVIIGQDPYGAAAGPLANLAPKIIDEQQLAAAFNIPFIDQTKHMPSYDHTADGNNGADKGLVHGDGFHASPEGYRDQADFITKRIMDLAGADKGGKTVLANRPKPHAIG